MAQRAYPKLFEVCIGQPSQNVEIDIVLSECLSVLSQSQILQPLLDTHAGQDPCAAWKLIRYSGSTMNQGRLRSR